MPIFQAVGCIFKRLYQLSPLHKTKISSKLRRARIVRVATGKFIEAEKSCCELLLNILNLLSGRSFRSSGHTGKLQNLGEGNLFWQRRHCITVITVKRHDLTVPYCHTRKFLATESLYHLLASNLAGQIAPDTLNAFAELPLHILF